MKISMYGAWDPTVKFEDSPSGGFVTVDLPGRELHANTLGEALAAYAEQFGVSIRPYDGSIPIVPLDPKRPFQFFLFEDQEHGEALTGVGVKRGQQYLVPDRDLEFPLEDGDIVSLGLVGCKGLARGFRRSAAFVSALGLPNPSPVANRLPL